MSERQELEELRRLDELEARASRGSSSRKLGLGVRDVAKGLASYNPFSVAADAVGGLYNTIADTAGIPGYRSYPIGNLADRASNAAGLPTAETEVEQRISRVNELGAGAVGTSAVARGASALPGMFVSRVAPSAPPPGFTGIPQQAAQLGNNPAQVFAANPVQQAVAGTVGPAAGEGLRFGGVPEPWPTVAEFALGMLTPNDATLSRVARERDVSGMIRNTGIGTIPSSAAGRATGGIRDIMTTEGRQNVVGRILRSGSHDPVGAEKNLGSIPTYVKGSSPTMGQASRDPGLLRLEGIAENTIDLPDVVSAPGSFAARRGQNTTARNTAMTALKPVDVGFERLRQGINGRFQPRLEAVMKERKFVSTQPILREIDDLLTTPGLGQRQELVDNLAYARERLDNLGPKADPKDLQAVRQDISELIEGKLKGAAMRDGKAVGGGVKGLSRSKMRDVVNAMDDTIEQGAPGYKDKWLVPYAKARQDLDRRKIVGEGYGKAQTTKNNADEQPILSAAGLDRWFKQNSAKVSRLTPVQRQTMMRVRADLKRAERGNSAEVQGVNSSTAKNLVGGASVATIIGRAMGGGPQRSPLPLGDKWKWLFGYTDRQINDLLIEAMLDPKLGKRLLSQANKEAMDEAASALQDLATKQATASTQVTQINDKFKE